MALLAIFDKMTYDQILDIADEYNFYPSEELPKNQFADEFATYLTGKGFSSEITSRYGVNKKVDPEVETDVVRLFSFQVNHKECTIEGFANHRVFLNTSETGTGKTYMTLSIAETERRPLFVICPKAMVFEWYLQGLKHNVEILGVCNYERMIKGKMYQYKSEVDSDNLPVIDNPYIVRIERDGRGTKKHITFQWRNLPEGTTLVFDEAHFCKNITAQRTQLLMSAYDYARHPENLWRRINIVLLSATIIERKSHLAPFMYVLGFANKPTDTSTIDNPGFSVRDFGRKLITERRMTRATMKEAREALKDNHRSDICGKVFDLGEEDRKKIENLCQEIRSILVDTAAKKNIGKSHLAVRVQKRREIEALKIGVIMGELKRLYNEGYAVAVFLNFRESLEALEKLVKEQMPDIPHSRIIGGQALSTRMKEIQNFVNGKTHIMISMITAGGTGISLHDVKGVRPRYSLISPPESATQTVQCFGRLDRIGSKSDSTQRVIFIRNTLEEKIRDNLANKIQMIGDLNNDNDDKADNLFLFDVFHKYEGKNNDEEKTEGAGEIHLDIDQSKKKIIVSVPDYMVDAFEGNIPAEALSTMQIQGKKYYFDVKFYHIIREYLVNLNT